MQYPPDRASFIYILEKEHKKWAIQPSRKRQTTFQVGMQCDTKLNWPRKNGPSLNLDRAASSLSRAATDEETEGLSEAACH